MRRQGKRGEWPGNQPRTCHGSEFHVAKAKALNAELPFLDDSKPKERIPSRQRAGVDLHGRGEPLATTNTNAFATIPAEITRGDGSSGIQK